MVGRSTRATLAAVMQGAQEAHPRMQGVAAGARLVGFALVAFVATSAFGPRAVAARSRSVVRKVSDPPALATDHFKLRVRGTARTVSILASTDRERDKGDVRVDSRQRVKKGHIVVSLPKDVAAGAWFIVVCPAKGHGSCAASKKPTVRMPAAPSPPVNGTPVKEASKARSATI